VIHLFFHSNGYQTKNEVFCKNALATVNIFLNKFRLWWKYRFSLTWH